VTCEYKSASAKLPIDQCRARGCGGCLRGVDAGDIADGSEAYCGKCGRRHVFHVYEDGGPAFVSPDRKQDTRPTYKRRKNEAAKPQKGTR